MKKSPKKTRKKPLNRYPKGWNAQKVQDVIDYYENQSDEDAAKEDDAAYHNPAFTMMAVPVELVPAVQKLIAKKAG